MLSALLVSLLLSQSLPLTTSSTGGVSLSTAQTITGAKTFSATLTAGVVTLSGTLTTVDILPTATQTSSLGSAAKQWFALYTYYIRDSVGTSRLTVGGNGGSLYLGFDADDANAIAHRFGSVDTLTTSGGLIAGFYPNSTLTDGTQVGGVTKDGAWVTGGLKAPVVHGAGTALQALESGTAAMTANALVVTFGTAFAAAPDCVCSHIKAVPVACGPAADPGTTGVTFNVAAGGTDKISWFCIGAR